MVSWVAYVAIAWALLIDYPGTISAGPISVSGVATLAVGVALLALYPAYLLARRTKPVGRRGYEPYLPARLHVPWAPPLLFAFAAWALLGLALVPTPEGVQNVAVYVSFVGAIVATAATSSAQTAARVHGLLAVVAVAVTLIALAGSLLPQLAIYGTRSFALTALILLAVTVPSRSRNLLVRLTPVLLVVAMILSLSRTATFVGVLMLPFMTLSRGRRSGRTPRTLLLYAAATYLLWELVTRYGPFRDRFTTGDGYSMAGVDLNTSGRSAIWSGTLESIRQGNLWLGQGPGSAAEYVYSRFPPITHPHNEYLRLWHDFGLIGLTFFVLGYGVLLWRTLRSARRAPSADAGIHWSAFLGLASVAGAAVTDNVLVYPFVMLPLGVLVGLSVARSVGPVGARQNVPLIKLD